MTYTNEDGKDLTVGILKMEAVLANRHSLLISLIQPQR